MANIDPLSLRIEQSEPAFPRFLFPPLSSVTRDCRADESTSYRKVGAKMGALRVECSQPKRSLDDPEPRKYWLISFRETRRYPLNPLRVLSRIRRANGFYTVCGCRVSGLAPAASHRNHESWGIDGAEGGNFTVYLNSCLDIA